LDIPPHCDLPNIQIVLMDKAAVGAGHRPGNLLRARNLEHLVYADSQSLGQLVSGDDHCNISSTSLNHASTSRLSSSASTAASFYTVEAMAERRAVRALLRKLAG